MHPKAAAVQFMLEHFHDRKEDSCAFSDSMNDLDLIYADDHGIAMGNGENALKGRS